WSQGATNWEAYLNKAAGWRVPTRQRLSLEPTLRDSLHYLEQGRVDYFARQLPKREHWRAISTFPRIGYLDIETDGGFSSDCITVIGLYCDGEMRTYLKGKNLAQFAYDCQELDGFVTFFGTGFDLPCLARRFPVLARVFADRLHIDLCPLFKRIGQTGGLKKIEVQVGIRRTPETEGLSGLDAVRLWRAYQAGGRRSEEAGELLVAYNREDVVNMASLLQYLLPRLEGALISPEAS
ncbi:MAG TPA: ribonuclease H-like domain-containing protein, partial [Capsulimonadaceae bacterium]|nr:ribonuclease H-like domain-containing protein [Capsulimonadaceae bacterium]